MTKRHVALYALFGLPIAGALAGSYLHLAAWLRPWMPPGWQALSWVAALALDGLILAPIMARQVVGADVPGLALRLAQATGILSSVYVNARWGHATMAPVTRWDLADVAVGAAILPVLALIGEHAMRAALAGLQAREAAALPAPATATRRRPATPAPRPAIAAPASVAGPAPDALPSAAELAERDGVSIRTAHRRLAAMRMTGMAAD